MKKWSLALCILLVCGSLPTWAQAGDLLRWFGYGFGAGYHAPRGKDDVSWHDVRATWRAEKRSQRPGTHAYPLYGEYPRLLPPAAPVAPTPQVIPEEVHPATPDSSKAHGSYYSPWPSTARRTP